MDEKERRVILDAAEPTGQSRLAYREFYTALGPYWATWSPGEAARKAFHAGYAAGRVVRDAKLGNCVSRVEDATTELRELMEDDSDGR